MHLFDNFTACLILQCKNVGFVKGECSEKSKARFHIKSAVLSLIKNVDFKLISFNKFKSVCQSCKHVPFSHVNGYPKNKKI